MLLIGIVLVGMLILFAFLEGGSSSSQSVPSLPIAKLVVPVTEFKDQLTHAKAEQKSEKSEVEKIVYICSKCNKKSVKSKKSPSKPSQQPLSVSTEFGRNISEKPDTSEKPADDTEVHEKQIASANCRVVKKAPPGFHDVEYDDRDSEWYERFYSRHPTRKRKKTID